MATEPTIERRLARLEEAVAEIQRQLASAPGRSPGTLPSGVTPAPGVPLALAAPQAQSGLPAAAPATDLGRTGASAVAAAPPPRDWAAASQLWIGPVGIVLLMLGLAFLYGYAVERGWLTPVARVAFGLVVGTTLLLLGARLSRRQGRRSYGLLLMGGGLGVLYLSAYAAFGFYGLVSAYVAVTALAVLALLAILLAANRDEVLLALLGALGALAAPLLVRTPRPSIPLFTGYVILVSVWAGWTAIREGWRSLAWAVALGAIVLFTLAASGAHPMAEEVWLTGGAGVSLLGLAAALIWREHRAVLDPGSWKRRPVPRWLPGARAAAPAAPAIGPERLDLASACWLAVLATVFFPLYASGALRMSPLVSGGTAFAEAALLAGAAWRWRRHDQRLARALALVAAAPLLAGTVLLQWRAYRGLFALEALGLIVLGRRLASEWLARLGHVVFFMLAFIYMAFLSGRHGSPLPATVVLSDAAAVAAVLLTLRFVDPGVPRWLYGGGGLLALLGWLYATLSPLAGGVYWVTLSWGVLGAALLVGAWLTGDGELRAGGLLVLACVALKLLLVDTATLPRGGRIIVFIGFGALFLALGALYRRGVLTRGPAPEPQEPMHPAG